MKITFQALKDRQTELIEKYGAHAQILYTQVSQTQLSIARYFGCAKIQGESFTYFPDDDMLVRDDVIEFLSKKPKQKP